MNGKSKLVWWLVSVVMILLAWGVGYVLSTQAKIDGKQDADIIQYVKNQNDFIEKQVELNEEIRSFLKVANDVNLIDLKTQVGSLNASLLSLTGQVRRFNNFIDANAIIIRQ